MNEVKVMRLMVLGHAEEMGILDKVKQHEARLAGRFIQQPTEEDLAAYGMAIALVAGQVEALMTNAEPLVKSGETEPAPIEVQLQPTAEQIAAGLKECEENGLYMGDMTEDVIVFIWQAMIGARPQ